MTVVACIGECMIEFKQASDGLYSRGHGGDTLNTAVYLARLGTSVDYITALGDDPLSSEMIAGWQEEGGGLAGGGGRHDPGRSARRQAAGHLSDRDRCEGRATFLPLA